ncbi:uncharacterized protein [Salminus brasiliensis]|uniref:uncharacterized protein n=1 Tax=Salminus brasiliensis TaxID=930266 RepID=UPI003B839208
MKHLERSISEGNGTVHQFDPRGHLGKEHTQENKLKERDEEEDRGSKVVESTQRVPELPEEYFHGLEDLPWNLTSLEQTVYLSLPVWVQAALLCNLAGQYGLWTFHNNFLPCRLISYLFLPYTLPATLMVSFSYRLLCWTRQIVQKAVLWAMGLLSTFSLLHPSGHLLDRFLLLPFPSLSALCFPPLPHALHLNPLPLLCLALHSVPRCLSASTLKEQSQSGKHRQLLQLSTADYSSIQPPKPATFAFLFNLELEVDCHCQANRLCD